MIRHLRLFGGIGLFLSLMLAAQSILADSIRIMPLGDSDTQGYGGYVSYRYDLWFKLIGAGYDVDFVGRESRTAGGVNGALYPRYDEMDQNHEGRYRALLEQMASSASDLAEVNQPHVVLIFGAHDICEYGSAAGAKAQRHLPEIIDNIRAVNPDTQFLLGQTYAWEAPGCHPDAPQIIPDYNEKIARAAAAKDTPSSRVLRVDHYTGFNAQTMFDGDAFHANRQGEMFIANNWFDALENIIPLIDTEGSSFVINAGLNDAWYNPATAGQGFFITVFPDIEMMFLAWFTYDTERPGPGVAANLGEPGHRWLTAFGAYVGNVAELDVELTAGGVFDAAQPETTQQAGYGTIQLEFNDCNGATLSYEFPGQGLMGMIELQRIANDNVPMCETLNDALQAQ